MQGCDQSFGGGQLFDSLSDPQCADWMLRSNIIPLRGIVVLVDVVSTFAPSTTTVLHFILPFVSATVEDVSAHFNDCQGSEPALLIGFKTRHGRVAAPSRGRQYTLLNLESPTYECPSCIEILDVEIKTNYSQDIMTSWKQVVFHEDDLRVFLDLCVSCQYLPSSKQMLQFAAKHYLEHSTALGFSKLKVGT